MMKRYPQYEFLGHSDTPTRLPRLLSSPRRLSSDPPLEDAREPWVRSDDDDAMRDARRRRGVVKNITPPRVPRERTNERTKCAPRARAHTCENDDADPRFFPTT